MSDSSSSHPLGTDWSVDCSDDEKYEISKKWTTVGVSQKPPIN